MKWDIPKENAYLQLAWNIWNQAAILEVNEKFAMVSLLLHDKANPHQS